MTPGEKTAEKIALLLLALPELERRDIHTMAWDLAERAELGWWEVMGRPYYNKQLASLRRKWEKKK